MKIVFSNQFDFWGKYCMRNDFDLLLIQLSWDSPHVIRIRIAFIGLVIGIYFKVKK